MNVMEQLKHLLLPSDYCLNNLNILLLPSDCYIIVVFENEFLLFFDFILCILVSTLNIGLFIFSQ